MHAPRLAIIALPLAASLILASAGASVAAAQDTGSKQSAPKKPQTEKKREIDKSKWLDKLKPEDRAAAEYGIGYALPAIPEGLEVVDGSIKAFKELRGKVVVLATFSTKGSAGLKDLEKLKAALEKAKLGEGDPAFIAIHTPEGIDKAKETLAKAKLGIPVVLDKDGALCDALGAYKVGITYLADRQGALRYAGLSDRGVIGALEELGAESFDETAEPKKIEDKPAIATVEFPTFSNSIEKAADLRGKQGPAPAVEKWWNYEPQVGNKLLVVDFWATWCPPCREAIPHMNEIAAAYPNDVACVGISSESNRELEDGLLKHRLKKSDFRYAVGIDPKSRMMSAFQIQAIPHVAIMSPDGIVRWQGLPRSITPQVMDSLIAANRANNSKGSGGPPKRWSRAKG
ncbi:MAG: hypothetical protein RL325_1255 [Planctomycetota bacterium]